jgi:hypothetical protein
MRRLLRYLLILLLLAAAAAVIWALVADLPPPTQPVEMELPDAALD